MKFSAMLDTPSLEAIAKMHGFGVLLEPEIVQALTESGRILVRAAQANTWKVFRNPSGRLAKSITFSVPNPEEVAVTVGVPYGHRREMGFNGVDALGRVYNDPAQLYLRPALKDNEDRVLELVGGGVRSALGRIQAA